MNKHTLHIHQLASTSNQSQMINRRLPKHPKIIMNATDTREQFITWYGLYTSC